MTTGNGASSVTSETQQQGICSDNKQKIVFFAQVFLIYAVIIASIINISLGSTLELWTILLTSCLGYLLPNPSLKNSKFPPIIPPLHQQQ